MAKNIPFVKKIMDLGCTDEKKINMALQTYIELNEGEAKSIDFFYNKEFNVIFFIVSHRDDNMDDEAYVPVNSTDKLSVSFIKALREAINKELGGSKSFVLVIRDSDSNCSKYKCTPGLKPPDSPETVRKFKREEEKEFYKRSEIEKNKKTLYKKAKMDSPSNIQFSEKKEEEVTENKERLDRKRKFDMKNQNQGGKVDEKADEGEKVCVCEKKKEVEKTLENENKVKEDEKDDVDKNMEDMIKKVKKIVNRINVKNIEKEKVKKLMDEKRVKNNERKEQINDKNE